MKANNSVPSNKPIKTYFSWEECGKLSVKQKEYLSQSGNILSLPSIVTITRIAGGCISEDEVIEFIHTAREKYDRTFIKEKINSINNEEESILRKMEFEDQLWFVLPYLMEEEGRKLFLEQNSF